MTSKRRVISLFFVRKCISKLSLLRNIFQKRYTLRKRKWLHKILDRSFENNVKTVLPIYQAIGSMNLVIKLFLFVSPLKKNVCMSVIYDGTFVNIYGKQMYQNVCHNRGQCKCRQISG